MAPSKHAFQTIQSSGGLLPVELLLELTSNPNPTDFNIPTGGKVNDAITQSYTKLRGYWEGFSGGLKDLAEDKPNTGYTNDNWTAPLLQELGFGFLPAGAGPEIDGRTFPISRFYRQTPIHLVGSGQALNSRTPGQRGAASASPHGIVQEFLNLSDPHLWGICSNGRQLRILRDNMALSRPSFLEFDLEAMFEGEFYADFKLLWLTTHAANFNPQDADRPETCQLEHWAQEADQKEIRVLGELRSGVENALQVLGKGFVSHLGNERLRESLRSGELSPTNLHEQLLRIVFRLVFLFVAEDKTVEGQPLIHPLDDSEVATQARRTYQEFYSTTRLREMAGKIKGNRHSDLWQQYQLIARALSDSQTAELQQIRQQLALTAFGSFLWSPTSTPNLNDLQLANDDFLEALKHLAYTHQGKRLHPVDFKNLGAEELGGVYEVLLALTPRISGDGTEFWFEKFAGNEQKTSGSYYTPDSLVQNLLDTALNPVVEQAIADKEPEERADAILDLKICDPAAGSGHFLVGAAYRLARHLARAWALAEGASEPSELDNLRALREVISKCIYGVDVNPMSAELCRVSLWMEAMEPGKPLSFLDHHIQVGNSLLGATKELIANGLPDDAFKPILGDDKSITSSLKKTNKQERSGGQMGLPYAQALKAAHQKLVQLTLELEGISNDTLEHIQKKEELFKQKEITQEYQDQLRIANAWCAAFVWPKSPEAPKAITTDALRQLEDNSNILNEPQEQELNKLTTDYRFFHWHLAFPRVFQEDNSDENGFDCVLGNPPWEKIKLQEKEWFAERVPEIAQASNAAERKQLISELENAHSPIYTEFENAKRQAEGTSHFLRNSGLYPLCATGDINLYAVFAEGMRNLLYSAGLMGVVLPSGIATDDTTKLFFQDVVSTESLVSLFDFENKMGIFPDVHKSYKFCLFTAGSGAKQITISPQFIFFAHQTDDLNDPNRKILLTAGDFAVINPNTLTCPTFRTRADVSLTKAIYKRNPVLHKESDDDTLARNFWGIKFSTMFHMSNDSRLFKTCEELELDGWILVGNIFEKNGECYLPLYEAKLYHQFDHRYATYENGKATPAPDGDKLDPNFTISPRYWVPEKNVEEKQNFDEKYGILENSLQPPASSLQPPASSLQPPASSLQPPATSHQPPATSHLITLRNIVRSTDVRSTICTIIPVRGVSNSSTTIQHI